MNKTKLVAGPALVNNKLWDKVEEHMKCPNYLRTAKFVHRYLLGKI